MKKFISLALALLMLSMLFGGCGERKTLEEPSGETTTTTADPAPESTEESSSENNGNTSNQPTINDVKEKMAGTWFWPESDGSVKVFADGRFEQYEMGSILAGKYTLEKESTGTYYLEFTPEQYTDTETGQVTNRPADGDEMWAIQSWRYDYEADKLGGLGHEWGPTGADWLQR